MSNAFEEWARKTLPHHLRGTNVIASLQVQGSVLRTVFDLGRIFERERDQGAIAAALDELEHNAADTDPAPAPEEG